MYERKEKIGIHPGFLFGFYKNNIGKLNIIVNNNYINIVYTCSGISKKEKEKGIILRKHLSTLTFSLLFFCFFVTAYETSLFKIL